MDILCKTKSHDDDEQLILGLISITKRKGFGVIKASVQ